MTLPDALQAMSVRPVNRCNCRTAAMAARGRATTTIFLSCNVLLIVSFSSGLDAGAAGGYRGSQSVQPPVPAAVVR
nr:hypothetical protein BB736_19110 [Mycobacterium avium subsp. hominissuis]